MTTVEGMTLIGLEARITISEMTFDVKIKNTKQAWGTDQLLIEPVTGSGSTWVLSDRVTLKKDKKDA